MMKNIYSIILGCLLSAAAVAQPAGWSYTQAFDVQNNVASQVINYQLQMTINTQTLIGAGQMNADGSDIRFGKDCAGTVLYNYWIESGINTPSTVIWVKIDTLPASGVRQIHMYYGNSSATPTSAIQGTFVGPHSSTDSVSTGSTGGVFNSQRGFRFAPTETILMTAVGKNEPTGSTRYVTLFDFTTQAILSQQQVSGPAAQYSYSNIATPLWLTGGTQYVLELFQGASDGYYFGGAPQAGQHITFLDMRYCNSCTQNTFPTNTLNGMHYGFVDMWYFTKTNIAAVPTVTTSGPLAASNSGPGSVCSNDSIAVAVYPTGGSGPYIYSWVPTTGVGNPTAASTMISTSVTTVYTCNITDACGTVNTQTIVIVANIAPTVTASVSTDSVCIGASFTPMGGGATSYSWSGGLTDNVAFTPSSTDTYTVTGTDGNGCTNTATATVEVLALPAVIANTSDDTLCEGSMVTLSGSGAAGYSWDNSVTDGVTFAATATTMYHVIGTDIFGCQNADSVNINVLAAPNVIATGTGPYCSGGSESVAASGADTYLWNPGALTGNTVVFNPATTTTYTLIGTDTLNGCVDSVTFAVVVYPNPVLSLTGDSACMGDCANLLATATSGMPAYTYNWTPATGLDNSSIANPQACNTVTMCYTATVTDANGCMDTQTTCAFINQLPVVSATGPSTVCVTDGNYTLSGTPASGTFSGPGVTGNTFSPSTAGNGTHQVIYSYTDANGCTAVDSITIVVSPCVGIADNNPNDGIEVYPNPFSDAFILNLSGTSHVRMFNNLGQIVLEQEMNAGRNDINTSHLSSGVYFIEVQNGEVISTIKVMKNN